MKTRIWIVVVLLLTMCSGLTSAYNVRYNSNLIGRLQLKGMKIPKAWDDAGFPLGVQCNAGVLSVKDGSSGEANILILADNNNEARRACYFRGINRGSSIVKIRPYRTGFKGDTSYVAIVSVPSASSDSVAEFVFPAEIDSFRIWTTGTSSKLEYILFETFLGALSLLLLVSLSTGTAAQSRYMRSTNLAFGLVSDTHTSEGQWTGETFAGSGVTNEAQLIALINYFETLDPPPEWMIFNGDLSVGSTGDLSFAEFLSDNLDASIGRFIVPGNHDPDYYSEDGEDTNPLAMYPNGENPFSELLSQFTFDTSVGNRNVEFGTVQLVGCNNMADTTIVTVSAEYKQCYANCNSPGKGFYYWQANGFASGNPNGTNPDWAGFTDTNSMQRVWIRGVIDSFQSRGGLWTIPCMHRGTYTPNVNTDNRQNLKSARFDAMLDFQNRGVDLVIDGDMHVVYYTDRIKATADGHYSIGDADSSGIHYLGVRSHYATRPIDYTPVPGGAGTVPFSKSNTGAGSGGIGDWAYGAYFVVHGDRMYVRFLEARGGKNCSGDDYSRIDFSV